MFRNADGMTRSVSSAYFKVGDENNSAVAE